MLRLDSKNLTPRAFRKVAYAGGQNRSNGVAAKSLTELAEWEINATRVSELTQQAGKEMKTQQTARVEAFEQAEAQRPLTQPREPSPHAPENPPDVGVVEMDGGTIRTRDGDGPRGVTNPHYRSFYAGAVVRLQSEASAEDPRPDIPSLFLTRPKVQKLVTQLHRQRGKSSTPDSDKEPSIGELLAEEALVENAYDEHGAGAQNDPPGSGEATRNEKYRPPRRLTRTCVATLDGAAACGRILAVEAADRGFDQAARKAFIGDGETSFRTVWRKHFQSLGYVPILDIVHLLSYVYALAMTVGCDADTGWALYVKWIKMIWDGQASKVHEQWLAIAGEQGVPDDRALPDDDPRRPIQRGVTYLGNNLDRVDYPRYRKLGLPTTSTLMESLVKEFNLRVKGTEKFWNDPAGAEGILTVRASLLSEDGRFNEFFETRSGCRYRRRSTWEKEQREMQAMAPQAQAP
jgi:hypothetical protein